MDKRYCYVCDILGYKNIMLNLSLNEQELQVNAWKDLVERASDKFDIIDNCLRASDTFFVKGGKSKDDLKSLLELSQCMINEGIKLHLPMRGAIAFGNVVLDKEDDLIFGDGVVKAFELAESQDWIGACCEPELPEIESLWDFDLVFVYPVPIKNRIITYCPVVSWNVPEYLELRECTSKFFKLDENIDWKYANRIQNTIVFGLFLKMIRYGLIRATPSAFSGDLPIWHIYENINELCHDARLRSGGWELTQTPDGKKTWR